jgi:hypothetical protein
MKVTGKISKILNTEIITSKTGKSFKRQNFIVLNDAFNQNPICFNTYAKESYLSESDLNKKVTIDFEIDCKESNGRYFNNLNTYSITILNTDNTINKNIVVNGKPEAF